MSESESIDIQVNETDIIERNIGNSRPPTPVRNNQQPLMNPNVPPTPDNLRELALKLVNEKRAVHGAPPLTYNPNSEKLSRSWVQTLATTNTFNHSPLTNTYGENLYMSSGSTFEEHIKSAINCWYDEHKLYNYTRGGWSPQTGHFTALVWKSTQFMSIGVAKSPDNKVYVCANFFPAGNRRGMFKNNVLPPMRA